MGNWGRLEAVKFVEGVVDGSVCDEVVNIVV